MKYKKLIVFEIMTVKIWITRYTNGLIEQRNTVQRLNFF